MIERNENNRTLTISRRVRRNNNYYTVAIVSDIPITPRCVRRFMMMQEDFIQLDFSLTAEELHEISGVGAVAIGDFVDDDIFGRFYVTEEQMPKYNKNTGGYDYSLKLEAEYMLWKNWIHCLTVEAGGELQRMEGEWGLTDRLQAHAQQIADEVSLITGRFYSVNVSAEKANEIHFIAYNGKNILESLNILADTWECEWWVESDVIHFGKMENAGTEFDFVLGRNVESMDIAKDQQTFASRIYAYGGAQNIPEDYDRKLEFTVTSITEDGFLDGKKTLKLEMIDSTAQDASTYSFLFQDVVDPVPDSPSKESGAVTYTQNSNMLSLVGKNVLQGTLETYFIMDSEDWAALDMPEVNARTIMILDPTGNPEEVNVPTDIRWIGNGRWKATAPINEEFQFGNNAVNVEFIIIWSVKFDQWSVHMNDSISIRHEGSIVAYNPSDLKKPVTVIFNGSEYNGLFYNLTKRIKFLDDNGRPTDAVPAGWQEGAVYTLAPLTLKVPISWYTPIYETGTMSKVGERRLHLPLDPYTNRYLPIDQPADMAQCVEMAVVFNEIFPKLTLRIRPGSISNAKKTQKIEHSDGSVSWEDWIQYSFDLQYCTDQENKDSDVVWSPFVFREDYMLDGAKLQAAFIAPTSMQSHGGMLGGMTFDVSFYGINTTTFTIIRNENYGAKLPNEYIMPSDRDELFLTGWNPKAMSDLGLISIAEDELARKANDYKDAIIEGQFTFTCHMMSDWLFDLEADRFVVKTNKPLVTSDGNAFYVSNGFTRYRLPQAGDKVTVYHDALNGGSKTSRIIGYEFKLDKPYDTPIYTIGETAAYSRLKQLEKKITKLS